MSKKHSARNTGMCLAAVIAMLPLAGLQAQSTLSDSITGRVHDIPNVTVSARQLPNKVTSSIPKQTFYRANMDKLGIQNIADAVRRFAGTDVRDYGGTGGLKTVSVRNMGAAHTAVSYDGIAVSNCQAGQIDIGRFSLDNVESLSLSIAQDDNLLQSARLYASAGVLNIETAHPVFSEERNWHLLARLKGGSFGMVNPYVRYAYQLSERTTVSLDADYLRSDGQYPFTLTNGKYKTQEKRYNSAIDSWHTEANLFHSFKDESTFDLKAYFYQSDRGLPGAVILYNPESNEHLWDKNAFVQGKYKKRFSEKWSLQVQGKYNYSWNKYRDEGVQYEDGSITDRYTQHEYYASGTALYAPFRGLSVSLAQDVAVNTLSSSLPDCPFPLRFTSLTALRLRYQWNRVKLDASLLNTWITESVDAGEAPDDLKRLSPSFSVSYQPWKDRMFFVRALYKSTFRTPTFNDLYYTRMGNRSLRPEKASEYNLGLTWSVRPSDWLSDLALTVDGYFNKVTDKIVAFPTTYIWKMANYGKAHIGGVDATLASVIVFSDKFSLNLTGSYTWQKAIDLTDSKAKNYKDQLPYTPKHNGNASASLDTPWFTLGYSVVSVGKRYYLAQNIPENEIEGYTEHNATLSRTFDFKSCDLRLQADLLNLTDKQYDVIKYYPMPGRSWKLTATINF